MSKVRSSIIVLMAVIASPTFAAGQRFDGHGGGGHFGGGGGHFGGHAHFGGFHGGGFHVGAGHVGRFHPSFAGHPNTSFGTHNSATNISRGSAVPETNAASPAGRLLSQRSDAVRGVLRSDAVGGALRNPNALHDPTARARIAANAATAGFFNRRGGQQGWWRHANGGYGWVGPLFWPFAYYDTYDYALWGGGYDGSFWDYNYGDIYAGLFAPYGYGELNGYFPQNGNVVSTTTAPANENASSESNDATGQVAQMCGDEGHDVVGLPLDKVQAAIQPNDEQRAALDDLANASTKAAQEISAACPTSPTLTAPGRLDAMETRIEAIAVAVQTIKAPLDRLYGLMNDEQKARLTALGQDQHLQQTAATDGRDARTVCSTQPDFALWPTAAIEQKVHPTEAQRASLGALQEAATKASDTLKASCAPADDLTPPARLDAAAKRLDALLQAAKTVSAALNDFYGTMTDEQKAQFESIGPERTAQIAQATDQTGTGRGVYHRHRRGFGLVQSIMRHIFSIAR